MWLYKEDDGARLPRRLRRRFAGGRAQASQRAWRAACEWAHEPAAITSTVPSPGGRGQWQNFRGVEGLFNVGSTPRGVEGSAGSPAEKGWHAVQTRAQTYRCNRVSSPSLSNSAAASVLGTICGRCGGFMGVWKGSGRRRARKDLSSRCIAAAIWAVHPRRQQGPAPALPRWF